ncbi:YafY family transcriptional regulator [Paenibacillus doosanensis]|uniref:helix-turn-helix transcriptional regulator n=1 Tax=Paenibacillus doosanensis TaxID=1229154 RepID=UPI00217FE89F|nr:YafY family protein [Paenibacillus doosanensis]MCS7459089.1 YafY family transcriptional regulator [Paenibacillus doosanensis]
MKLDRLLAITMLLLNRKRVGAQELAERFEVSLRTVYRDLETLNQAGIPIVSYAGASGGYEIMDQYRLDRQFLSLEELQSIVIGLKGVRSSLDEQEIGGLLDKVGALLSRTEQGALAQMSQQMIIDMNPWHGGKADKEKLGILREAARSTKLIRFSYTDSQGESSERRCEPMSVVLKGYVWYLYGYCLLREDYRVFRLSRIEELHVLSETFVRRPKTLEQLGYGWNRSPDTAKIRLVLQFQPRMKPRVQDYYRDADIVTQPDGTLLVTTEQPDEPWLYNMLLSSGTDVKIIEPDSVAQSIREIAQKIVEMYTPARKP